MKTYIAFFAVIVAVCAKPQESIQYHTQDETGQYSYGYSNDLGSKAETRSLDGVTRGNYRYVDPDGNQQKVEYSSDSLNGFRVTSATNLPVAPAVPEPPKLEVPLPVEDTPEVTEAKSRHLEALKLAESDAPVESQETETPEPVKETPEVAEARANHLEAVKLVEARNAIVAKVDSFIPVIRAELPYLTSAHFVIPPVQLRTPLFAYNYHIPGALVSSSNTYFTPGLPTYVADVGAIQEPNAIVSDDKDSVEVTAKAAKEDVEVKSD